MEKLSVVIPVYNGADSIERLVDELHTHLSPHVQLQVVMVNDFSRDDSWEKLKGIKRKYPNSVVAVNLALNCGEHNAVMAGYHYCEGDYIANIDDDFQNPPAEILKLLDKIKEGYDVVYSQYEEKRHSLWRNLGSKANDLMANYMLHKPKDLYLSSFRIINRALLKRVILYQGPYPYIDGLILQNTAKIAKVMVDHHERQTGQSNYTLYKLLRLWSHAFFNFSIKPLRVAVAMGLGLGVVGFLGAIIVLLEKLFYPSVQVGWASILFSICLLTGAQMFMVGIIGEYVGRIYLSQNNTPQYVVDQVFEED